MIKNFETKKGLNSAVEILKKRQKATRNTKTYAIEGRMKLVANKNGVIYINDSMAINVDAVYFALQETKKDIIWITGGAEVKNLSSLNNLVEEKVKAIICLGTNNQSFIETFEGKTGIIRQFQSMQEAVLMANDMAQEGDSVLLSPACASCDLFKNNQEKGREFENCVAKL